MLQNYWKFKHRHVQTFGIVYHDTNGLNHGPVWKTQSFLLSEICTIILWQDCYGKGNWRTSNWNAVGRKFPIENVYSYIVKKVYSFPCMWMTSNWLERNKTLIRCGNYSTKKLIWENQHLWSSVYGMHSTTMWNKQRYCWQLQNNVSIQNSRRSNGKIIKLWEFSNFFMVLWYGKSCQEMCGTMFWELNNSAKYLLHALMIIIPKRKNWNL